MASRLNTLRSQTQIIECTAQHAALTQWGLQVYAETLTASL